MYRLIRFGPDANRGTGCEGDAGPAVCFNLKKAAAFMRHHELMRICANPEVDVWAQPFHAFELIQPCGIIYEVVTYGVGHMYNAKKAIP